MDFNNVFTPQKGGDGDKMQPNDPSSESSSDSSGSSNMFNTPLEKEMKQSSEEMNQSPEDQSPEEMKQPFKNMSNGRNNYVSSSAHSNEINSNSNMSSTISDNNNRYLSDSINTSDINMISVE